MYLCIHLVALPCIRTLFQATLNVAIPLHIPSGYTHCMDKKTAKEKKNLSCFNNHTVDSHMGIVLLILLCMQDGIQQ